MNTDNLSIFRICMQMNIFKSLHIFPRKIQNLNKIKMTSSRSYLKKNHDVIRYTFNDLMIS